MSTPRPPRPITTPGDIRDNADFVYTALAEGRTVILRQLGDRLQVLALHHGDTTPAGPHDLTSSLSPREETTP